MSEADKDKRIADLQLEVRQLKSILDKLPGNVYWKTKDDYFLGGNENVAKILKLASSADISGKSAVETLPLDIARTIRDIDLEVIEGEKKIALEEHGIDPEGNPTIYFTQKAPLYDDQGELIGLIGISMDISQQKKVEESLREAKRSAEAASRAKSQFLAMISHELRTPLTSIIGFANFLQQIKSLPDEAKTYVEYMIDSGDYLLNLINRILDYSKLEADKVELKLETINLRKTIMDVKSMLNGLASIKDLPLCLEYDVSAPEFIVTDGRLLSQILINLIGNAIKFTQVGQITIKVNCLEKRAGIVKLEIAIKDTGIGIDAKQIKSIFEEFYQAEDIYTRTTNSSGTGLGLAIVRKLAALLNAEIQVSSVVNKGTAFYLTANFPIALNSEQQSEGENKKRRDSNQLLGYRILLVEDDKLIQFIHQKMLMDLGCQVDVADHGKKALDMFENNYQLIFVDIGLPYFSGFDVIKEMRKRDLPGHRIPIIALTGFSTDEEKDRCIQAGADAVIVKPVSQTFLAEMLYKYAQ